MAYQVFISYRRQGAPELAMLLYTNLSSDGYAPFLDMEGIRSGSFSQQIFDCINECSDLLVLLSKNAFSDENSKEDWLYQEIHYALQHGKNVIPVIAHGFEWPDTLPQGIESLRYCQGVEINMEYFDASYQKIRALLSCRPSAHKKPFKRTHLWALIALCAGVGLAGAAFFYNQADYSPANVAVPASTQTAAAVSPTPLPASVAASPTDEINVITPLSNLNISMNSTDNSFLVEWDGNADTLQIAYGKIHLIYRCSVAGLSSFSFDSALPNTTYTVTLWAGDDYLMQTFSMPQAQWYTRFGAKPGNAKISWADTNKLINGKPSTDQLIPYQTLSKSEFIEKMKSYSLFGVADFIYTQKSTEHEARQMWLLHTPSGDVIDTEGIVKFSAQNESISYSSSFPLNDCFKTIFSGNASPEIGTYTFELYLDNLLVASTSFLIV